MSFIMTQEEYEATYYSDELSHYGVPGMKWGKRKARDGLNNLRNPLGMAQRNTARTVGVVQRQAQRGLGNVRAIGGQLKKLDTPRNRKIAGIATAAVVAAGITAGGILLAKSGGNPVAALGSAKGIGKGLLDFSGSAVKGAGAAAARGVKEAQSYGALAGTAGKMAGRAARTAGARGLANAVNNASNARETVSRAASDVAGAARGAALKGADRAFFAGQRAWDKSPLNDGTLEGAQKSMDSAYFGLKNAGKTSVSQIMSLAAQAGGAATNAAGAATQAARQINANRQQAVARRFA